MYLNTILVILDKREITRRENAFNDVCVHFLIKYMFLNLYKALKQFHHALFLCKREISDFLPKKRGDKSVIFSVNRYKLRWQAV